MSRLNLRKRAVISYSEADEGNSDEYIFCTECGDYVVEYCSLHGPLLVIPDTEVPKPGCSTPVNYAALTIPEQFLYIAPSVIPGAGLGVFTRRALPRDVRFGPYRGSVVRGIKSQYCWQIYNARRKPSYVIDAKNINNSNWMRYVNCSRHWLEQNLLAYQYRGQIYYRTIKIIPKNTEVLVYYGSEYAKELGIDIKKYNISTYYTHCVVNETAVANYDGEDQQNTFIPNENEIQTEKETITIHFNEDCTTVEDIDNENHQNIHKPEELQSIHDTSKMDNCYFENNKLENDKEFRSLDSTQKNISSQNDDSQYHVNYLQNENIHLQPQENYTVTEQNGSEFAEEVLAINMNFQNHSNYTQNYCYLQNENINIQYNDNNLQINNENLQINENSQKNVDSNSKLSNEMTDNTNFQNENIVGIKKNIAENISNKFTQGFLHCSQCEYKTRIQNALELHFKLHDLNRKHVCPECYYRFTDFYTLKRHLFLIHKSKMYTQQIITGPKTHTDVSNQKNITETNKTDNENIDNKNSQNVLNDLQFTKNDNGLLQCCKCNYITFTPNAMKTHRNLHDETRIFTCYICKYRYTSCSSLKKHLLNVHNKDDFTNNK